MPAAERPPTMTDEVSAPSGTLENIELVRDTNGVLRLVDHATGESRPVSLNQVTDSRWELVPAVIGTEYGGGDFTSPWLVRPMAAIDLYGTLEPEFRDIQPWAPEYDVPSELLTTIQTTDLIEPDNFRARLDPERGRLDLRHVLIGSHKCDFRSARVVGKILKRYSAGIPVTTDDALAVRVPVIVSPEYAAAFPGMENEANIKVRHLSMAFTNPTAANQFEMDSVCQIGRALIDQGTESTRFIFRLASLYVETAFYAGLTHRGQIWDIGMQVEIKTISTWTVWKQMLLSPEATRNYVPWWPLNDGYYPVNKDYVDVLLAAASENVTLRTAGEPRNPVLWPGIRNLTLLLGTVDVSTKLLDVGNADSEMCCLS